MPKPAARLDLRKFTNAAQVGGIESYVLNDGPARGLRVLRVNTGGGLHYRILVDRGMDIDHAFMRDHSLTFLRAQGHDRSDARALDNGLDWLKGFGGGLLTTCGPTNIGFPGEDAGEQLGLHGTHSNTAASLESVIQPDPHAGRLAMSVTGVIRYGALYGPCLELRRTIASELGGSSIDIIDEFFNAANQPVPHAWLLHINFGYPLLDAGAELCYDATKVEATDTPESAARFREGGDYKKAPEPQESHRGPTSAVAYLYPRPLDQAGRTTVAIVNRKLSLAVAVHYNTRQFPRCGNWQHWGSGEYVTALEPMNGTIEGRSSDRKQGLMDTIEAGGRRRYRYRIQAITERAGIAELLQLNSQRPRKKGR